MKNGFKEILITCPLHKLSSPQNLVTTGELNMRLYDWQVEKEVPIFVLQAEVDFFICMILYLFQVFDMDHCYVCCTLSHFIAQLQWYFIRCFRYGEHGWTRPRFPQMVIEISPSRCQRISYREYRLLREQHVDIPTRPSLREELSKPNLLNVFDF